MQDIWSDQTDYAPGPNVLLQNENEEQLWLCQENLWEKTQ